MQVVGEPVRGVVQSRLHPGGEDMSSQDLEYYRGRITAEQVAAACATHPLAAECHRRLAEEYASMIIANGLSAERLPVR